MLNTTTLFTNLTSSKPATYAAPAKQGWFANAVCRLLGISTKPAAGSYAAMQAYYTRK